MNTDTIAMRKSATRRTAKPTGQPRLYNCGATLSKGQRRCESCGGQRRQRAQRERMKGR